MFVDEARLVPEDGRKWLEHVAGYEEDAKVQIGAVEYE